MSPIVRTEDLVDATDVAALLGLAHRNSVTVYQRRYADMPRPVIDMGRGRAKLWLRQEIERWAVEQVSAGRTRQARRTNR